MTFAGADTPAPPCQPVCSVDSQPVDMFVCDVCGSLWLLRDVTEVDPVTFQPTRIARGWVRR